MGLCKCPRKNLTNQFCFEHRVNVCEHCIVQDHPQCVVQSYLRWLNDSDYNPVCQLCQEQLTSAECIRLVCYDLFHITCLDEWAKKLPPTTAPAGYRCPVCSSGIFPAKNLVSPVADSLKTCLQSFEWARAGLDLPIISSMVAPNDKIGINFRQKSYTSDESIHDRGIPDGGNSGLSPPSVHESYSQSIPVNQNQHDSFFSSSQHRNLSSKLSPKDSESSSVLIESDDGDKYKRKSVMDWLNRITRTLNKPSSRHHQSLLKVRPRFSVIMALLIFGIIVFLILVGRRPDLSDPAFNLLNNPNIRVQHK